MWLFFYFKYLACTFTLGKSVNIILLIRVDELDFIHSLINMKNVSGGTVKSGEDTKKIRKESLSRGSVSSRREDSQVNKQFCYNAV